ncbi:MAG TPA: M24 family metallopeptidase [Planctomycetaceae bacterium]|jgi:Xaa-Pro aminopeptidase|nr:M24 family metallopeptidase [Planctomycetaceae bacterium]
MIDISAIQSALHDFGIDGWLLYDFRGSNVLAQRVLGLAPSEVGSRRYAYCIPARGEPRKLVHRIEEGALSALPGSKTVYLRWQEFEQGLAHLASGLKRVAMEYSPDNAIPYVSRVDAGTVELVKKLGVEVVSSGDLIQVFEAAWDDEQERSHFDAAVQTNTAYTRAWRFIAEAVRRGTVVDEIAVQAEILKHFAENDLETEHPPIVAVGPHSGNPHHETSSGPGSEIRDGDFVLIDLWAKLKRPRAVYSDLTRVGFVGQTVPPRYTEIFQIVAKARDAAIETVRAAFAEKRPLAGCDVDRAARHVIESAGYGDRFVHRTGHSIGQETHGNGANIDDLETHDIRRILPRTCFSIEPGIYLPEFGVRSEVNVYIDRGGKVHVTGGPVQTAVVKILADY